MKKSLVFLLLFLSISVMGAKNIRHRYVYGALYGQSYFNGVFAHTTGIALLTQRISCKGVKFRQATFDYSFASDYKNYGLGYKINILKPSLHAITFFTYLGAKASRFELGSESGFNIKPELGFCIIFSRKKNPYISLDISYGYDHTLVNPKAYTLFRHSANALLCIGLVNNKGTGKR